MSVRATGAVGIVVGGSLWLASLGFYPIAIRATVFDIRLGAR